MRRAVITGATGMIGNALLHECLKHNIEVMVIVRPDSENFYRIPDSLLIQVCECSLEGMNTHDFPEGNWDVFYHFAWNYTKPAYRDQTELQYINIGQTLDALKLAKKLGCRKFIGAGSQAEYGPLNLKKITPDSPANPVTAYGTAKLAAGRLGSIWARQNAIDFIWGRIFSVYGKYDLDTTMLSNLIYNIEKDIPMEFTEGKQRWDYLFSSDAGRAFYLMGEKARGERIYCVGSGNALPLRKYIETVRDLINPHYHLNFGAIPYGKDTVMNLCADISALCNDIGFIPEIDFECGIKQLLSDK